MEATTTTTTTTPAAPLAGTKRGREEVEEVDEVEDPIEEVDSSGSETCAERRSRIPRSGILRAQGRVAVRRPSGGGRREFALRTPEGDAGNVVSSESDVTSSEELRQPKRARRNALEERLHAAIIERSVATTWEEACQEWKLAHIRLVDDCSGTCICTKRGLKFLCVLRNAHNGNLAVVGSDCVARFHDTAAGLKATVDSAFRCLSRIASDPWHKALNKSLAGLAKDCGFISAEDVELALKYELDARKRRRIGVPAHWGGACPTDAAWQLMFANLDILNAFCDQPACTSCGRPSELRARKSDGKIFYGCSTYPACKTCSEDQLKRVCTQDSRMGSKLPVAPRVSEAWGAARDAPAAIALRAARHRAARETAAADWRSAVVKAAGGGGGGGGEVA